MTYDISISSKQKEIFKFEKGISKYKTDKSNQEKLEKEQQINRANEALDAIIKHIRRTKSNSYSIAQEKNKLELIVFDTYHEKIRMLEATIEFDNKKETDKYYDTIHKIFEKNTGSDT